MWRSGTLRPPIWVVVAVAAAASMLWAAAPAAATGASSTTSPSTTSPSTSSPSTSSSTSLPAATTTTIPSPPPVDLTDIRKQQRAVVVLRYNPIVAPARATLAAAESSLAGAQNQLQQDQQTSINAATTATLAGLALKRDEATEQQDDAENVQAQATLAAEHRSLVAIAVQLYVGDPTNRPATTPEQLEQLGISRQLAQAAITHIAAMLDGDRREATATQTAVTQAVLALHHDAATLAGAQGAAQRAAAAIDPDRARVTSTTARLQSASSALQAANAQVTGALATLGSLAPDGSISILGTSALDSAQLVAWFETSGFVDLTATPLPQLAAWYLSEGTREGVRGDVAFAQSVVETGGFSSSDAVTLNNYAGIGHCDSCAAGGRFSSPQLGIRAQMQLLRTFATPGLTSAQLADPPASALAVPENNFRRGCCASWQALTGTWATSPIYGPVVLNIYQQILDYTVSAASAGAA